MIIYINKSTHVGKNPYEKNGMSRNVNFRNTKWLLCWLIFSLFIQIVVILGICSSTQGGTIGFFSSIAAGSKRWQYSTTSVIRKPNFFRLHLDAAIHPKSCVHFPSIFARTDLYHLVFSAVISRLFSLLFFHKAASPLSLSCSCWSSIKFK